MNSVRCTALSSESHTVTEMQVTFVNTTPDVDVLSLTVGAGLYLEYCRLQNRHELY
jgi:hypothetical protein